MADDDEEKAVLVMAVKDFKADAPDPGSTIEPCGTCKQDCYVAPTSKRIMEVDPSIGIVCCCCAGVHTMEEFMMQALKEETHLHTFRGELCDCGVTEEAWLRLPQQVRDNVDLIKAARKAMGYE